MSRIGLLSHVLLAPTWPAHLLAKEVAGIDGVSGGRLTLGIGAGVRDDDFVVEGHGPRDRGRRLDADLGIYRSVWKGAPVGGGSRPAVPPGTRQVPLLFGATSDAAFRRAAREGDGYIGATLPPSMVASSFDAARAAWDRVGRSSPPRLVALSYVGVGALEQARANVHDYYSVFGDELATMVSGSLAGGTAAIRERIAEFEELGADELMLLPGIADLDEVARLADTVL